ncbi:MAG: hypothetical protein RL150_661 [Candidatus Parcubacteria bacterium]
MEHATIFVQRSKVKIQKRIDYLSPVDLTCRHRRGAAGVPVVVERAVAPVPLAITPTEGGHTQAGGGDPVDGPPEKDVAGLTAFVFLPLIGDECGIGQKIVQKVCIEAILVGELLAKLVTLNPSGLLGFGEVERDFRGVPLQLSSCYMTFDTPSLPNEGVGIEIDDVFHRLDFCFSSNDTADVRQGFSLTEFFDVGVRPTSTAERERQFVGLARSNHKRVIFHFDVFSFL